MHISGFGYSRSPASGGSSDLAGISARFDSAIAAQQSRIAGLNDLIATLMAEMQALDPPSPLRPRGASESDESYQRRVNTHRQKVDAFEAAWARLEAAVAVANRQIEQAEREISQLESQKMQALERAERRLQQSIDAARARQESTLQRERAMRELQEEMARTAQRANQARADLEAAREQLARTMEQGLERELAGSMYDVEVEREAAPVLLHDDDDGIADAFSRGLSIELRDAATGRRADADILAPDTLQILPVGEELDETFVATTLASRLEQIEISEDSFAVLRRQLIDPAWPEGRATSSVMNETAAALGLEPGELALQLVGIDPDHPTVDEYTDIIRSGQFAEALDLPAGASLNLSEDEARDLACRILADQAWPGEGALFTLEADAAWRSGVGASEITPAAMASLIDGGGIDTDRAAMVQQIDDFIASVPGSPMQGMGEVFVQAGEQYGIDPRFLAAIARSENALGTSGASQQLFNTFGIGPGRQYGSWEENVFAAAELLARPDGYYRNASTIEEVGGIWCPVGAANDPTGLNNHWVPNVSRYFADLGGDPNAAVRGLELDLSTSLFTPPEGLLPSGTLSLDGRDEATVDMAELLRDYGGPLALSDRSGALVRDVLINPAWEEGFAPQAKWDETAELLGMEPADLMARVLDLDVERYADTLSAYRDAYTQVIDEQVLAAPSPGDAPRPSDAEVEAVAIRILAGYRLSGSPTSLLDPATHEVLKGSLGPSPALRLEELKAAGLVDPGARSYPRLAPPPEFVAAGYQNGRLPEGSLVPLGINGHALWEPAAEAFQVMLEAARADGVELSLTDSYRTYEGQVRCKEKWTARGQPGMAATPGTSNHGWGLAVDMDFAPSGSPQSRAEGLAWMREHAYEFGFVEALRPGDSYEDWHWEFRPSGDPSSNLFPRPDGLETVVSARTEEPPAATGTTSTAAPRAYGSSGWSPRDSGTARAPSGTTESNHREDRTRLGELTARLRSLGFGVELIEMLLGQAGLQQLAGLIEVLNQLGFGIQKTGAPALEEVLAALDELSTKPARKLELIVTLLASRADELIPNGSLELGMTTAEGTSADVRAVQALLEGLGLYEGELDGDFDEAVQRAVTDLQESLQQLGFEVAAHGRFDEATRTAITTVLTTPDSGHLQTLVVEGRGFDRALLTNLDGSPPRGPDRELPTLVPITPPNENGKRAPRSDGHRHPRVRESGHHAGRVVASRHGFETLEPVSGLTTIPALNHEPTTTIRDETTPRTEQSRVEQVVDDVGERAEAVAATGAVQSNGVAPAAMRDRLRGVVDAVVDRSLDAVRKRQRVGGAGDSSASGGPGAW